MIELRTKWDYVSAYWTPAVIGLYFTGLLYDEVFAIIMVLQAMAFYQMGKRQAIEDHLDTLKRWKNE